MEPALLVADVGGTNARFAVAVRRGGRFSIEKFEMLAGDDFKTFDDAVAHYLNATGVRPDAACFAVAGPVRRGEAQLTNRDWHVSGRGLSDRFGIEHVRVVNDFVAMARSVPELGDEAFEPIFEGEADPAMPMLVTGPGTGFGVAVLVPAPAGWTVIGGEGGHMAYAPRTDLERQLSAILMRDRGYVSNELVASGSGLPAVHRAFCEIYGVSYAPLPPAEILALAEAGDEMFLALIRVRALTVMGAAGDMAIATTALGGVVLAGGVTQRIKDFLKLPEARERFVSRGPMSGFLQRCPVRLLHDAEAPLIGAAAYFEQARAG